jgi:hypothetical protein
MARAIRLVLIEPVEPPLARTGLAACPLVLPLSPKQLGTLLASAYSRGGVNAIERGAKELVELQAGREWFPYGDAALAIQPDFFIKY